MGLRMAEMFEPTLAAAHARITAVRPADYARTRNALEGAVSGLSPYITHGFVTLDEVMAGVAAKHTLHTQHKFVMELGWRAYFRHVWSHRGDGIFESLHQGPLPDSAYATELPADIRLAATGVPVIDESVRTLYGTGMLHNHARMWLASYVVHVRKVHWRTGADWLYSHLLDGDLASNHLSWQWVAGTGSHKPYLFNADNVARYAPAKWYSPDSVIDTSYEELDLIARDPSNRAPSHNRRRPALSPTETEEPHLCVGPPPEFGYTRADATLVAERDVWIVHPWSLGPLPASLPSDALVIGLFVADFHEAWPWSLRRWQFVSHRMAQLAAHRWHDRIDILANAFASARSVRAISEPHLTPWLARMAECIPAPCPFTPVALRCDSFSKWWPRVSRDLRITAANT